MELLVKKGGDTKWYCDALWKLECAYMVEDVIAKFGRQHGVCGQALTGYVVGFLHRRLHSGDGNDPYYPSGGDESKTTKSEKMKVMMKMVIVVMMSAGIVMSKGLFVLVDRRV